MVARVFTMAVVQIAHVFEDKYMKKCYFVEYYLNFGNTYNLWWADSNCTVPDSFERISRKEAIKLCIEERQRRKYDSAFSGYASSYIRPITGDEDKPGYGLLLDSSGYIILN